MQTNDTPEAFQSRVEKLALSLGISYPLDENELRVKKATFTFPDSSTRTFWADPSSKASRAFLQELAGEYSGKTVLTLNAERRDDFQTFYGCYWYDSPDTGKHPFIDAVRHAKSVDFDTLFDDLDEPRRIIEEAWRNKENINTSTKGEVRDAVDHAFRLLERGEERVAEPDGQGGWKVNEWLKQAVLLSFRLNDNAVVEGGAAGAPAFDKVPLKFNGWDEARFRAAGFRVVPGAAARRGTYIAKGVVLMPSFVNIGAYIGENTMIDTWATVGSCAQIGKNVHISGGAGIGGVLEPLQAKPVIIEDGAFIGARCEVAEGVRVGEGAVLAMGVFIGASTKIVDRATGEIYRGEVPPYAVVVPGTLPGKALPDGTPGPSLYCAVIVKTVDAKTRAKTGINELLRD